MGSLNICKLENGCDALLKYYNTSILSHPDMDPDLKEACYAEAKECADKNNARSNKSLKRTVLAELISSHQNQQNQSADSATKKPYADYIAGPESLTLQWSPYYKKLIYIFGETHSKDYDCPSPKLGETTMLVEDYIKQLYINGDMFLDVFDETGAYFQNKEPYTRTTEAYRIDGIRNHFTQCLLDANLDQTNCRKGRVHYFDIRSIEEMYYGNISNFVHKYAPLFGRTYDKDHAVYEQYLDYFNFFFTEQQVLDLIEDVCSYSYPEDLMKSLKKELNENYLFKKELRKSNIKDQINSFIDEYIENYVSVFQSIIDSIQILNGELESYKQSDVELDHDGETKKYPLYNFDDLRVQDVDGDNYEHFNFLKKLLDKIYHNLLLVETLLADGYLLARVFKVFNIDDEDETKQRLTDEPYQPHNIVIYAGDNHSDRYRDFLKKKLNFELIAVTGKDWRDKHSTNPYEYCISMKEFPQPFFEYDKKVNWLEDVSSDKKPYTNKNWVKRKSRQNKGRYYYLDPTKGISQFNRPVDYSSDEEEYMTEDSLEEETMSEEEVNLSEDVSTLPRRSSRLKQIESSISKQNKGSKKKGNPKPKYKRPVDNSKDEDM